VIKIAANTSFLDLFVYKVQEKQLATRRTEQYFTPCAHAHYKTLTVMCLNGDANLVNLDPRRPGDVTDA